MPAGLTAANRPKWGCLPPWQGGQLELEERLVPRKMSISILEGWLTACYLLPRLNTGGPGTVFPAQFYEYLPSQWGKGPSRGSRASQILCKNLLNIH